ncbi:MAG: hypothetical protein ACPGNV_08500 [Mangrovicoccus sp.]
MQNTTLWEKIRDYDFNAGLPEGSFEYKVAKALSLSPERADAAILEYRRFLYLLLISVVKPSASHTLNAMWNAHLGLQNGAWENFYYTTFGGTLRRFNFTAPISSEKGSTRFGHLRDLYLREFGEEPPAKYWPDTAGVWMTDEERNFRKKMQGGLAIFAAMMAVFALAGGVIFDQLPLAGTVAAILGAFALYEMMRCRRFGSGFGVRV